LRSQDRPKFPKRVYTEDEVKTAKTLIDNGYKHHVTVRGSTFFKQKVEKTIVLVKTAGYYDFFRTYIARVQEIDGVTQLRQSEASIWANDYAVENPVDAGSVFVQKASHMKEYLEGAMYYGGQAEKRSAEKRIEFLEALKKKSLEKEVVAECERLIKMWKDSALAY
jgi:hypothetical protein